MEGENCRGKGCEFERLGVDDIYAHRSYHRLFCLLLFLLPIFFPASSSSYPLIFPHESCTRSPRAYSSLRVQMRRQIWFQVARPGYEPSLSARISINLTENQLRNNFIDRPSKSPVNEPRLKANPRSSVSYNRRRHPFLPNRNRIECIESVENS